jgi:mono/diheme cytochrome c family protein
MDDTPEAAVSETEQAVTLADRLTACARDPRVVAGVANIDTCVGADLFLRETFNGNGRSCATCHRVDRNFGIDPAFMLRLPASDPLFIAERNATLAGLEIPAQMRRFGLILENVDGFAPDPRTHFVLRSVPHTLSLATSVTRAPGDAVNPPAERTGWSGDGAPGSGSLRDFQTGAITQHYTRNLDRVAGRDFRLADSGELDRIDLFMRRIGRTNELVLANVKMSDARAEAGRVKFLAVGCNACHTNAGANAGFGGGGNRNFNTGVETARHPALASFPHDGGFLAAPANANGSFGDGTFNAPPLIEAADTGPFFHTAVSIVGASAHNTAIATTIEEAIAFYDSPAFNSSPSGLLGPIDLTATEIDDIGRFLRGTNAVFNAAQALKRLDAELAIVSRFHNSELAIQREMLRLANVEVSDALRVLVEVPSLNPGSSLALASAALLIESARTASSETDRALAVLAARGLVSLVSGDVGTNLTFQIGDGSVMF